MLQNLNYIGNKQILDYYKIAFLCSRKCPADIILKSYDWAIEQREKDVRRSLLKDYRESVESDTAEAKAEVLNYLKVLEDLPKLAEHEKITEKAILKIHKLLTADVLENPADCGAYRNRQVVIGNKLTGVITFRPPDTKDVPVLMKEFVKWLSSKDASETNPVLTAGISHYEFVRIHPFIDGNGRTARTLASLILYLRGQIALTERQMRIVERINNSGFITNKARRELFRPA